MGQCGSVFPPRGKARGSMLGRRKRASGSGWVLGQLRIHALSSVDTLSSFCPEDLVSLCQAVKTGKASGTD